MELLEEALGQRDKAIKELKDLEAKHRALQEEFFQHRIISSSKDDQISHLSQYLREMFGLVGALRAECEMLYELHGVYPKVIYIQSMWRGYMARRAYDDLRYLSAEECDLPR